MAQKKLSVEESLKQINEIIEQLEQEDVTLDASMKLYNKGVKLLNDCNGALDKVEKQLIVLGEENADE